MEDRFLGNATEESMFSGHMNSSDLNALKEEGKCSNDNANSSSTALLVRLHCWSDEASGELFFHSDSMFCRVNKVHSSGCFRAYYSQ